MWVDSTDPQWQASGGQAGMGGGVFRRRHLNRDLRGEGVRLGGAKDLVSRETAPSDIHALIPATCEEGA